MRNATELLVAYARHHRDRRNITTHMLGVPMIIGALGILLGAWRFSVGSLALTLAWLAYAPVALWWLSRHLTLGMVSALWVGALLVMAQAVPQAPWWLGWGVGLFVLGWAFQFLGHYYEGRKPAFVDDLTGLAIAPFFLSAEVLFALGWNRPLQQAIEAEAGPLHLRDLAHP